MQDVGYAALQVIPSFNGFEGQLERGTRGPLSSAGRKGGTVFGDSAGRSMVSSISKHAKHAAFLAAGAFSAAAAGGVVLLRSSFAEARESQKVAALTASVIKSTGGAANVTAKQIDKLSFSIGKKAAIDDETVASGLNMLLTFKNVRNEVGKGNKIFDRAGQTITDMAAAMAASSGGEVDLKSASIQVGKALNDPVKGITALSRVGVTFTAQQKKQIEALVATGDTMGAQKIILRELRSEFGGAAASQATGADKVEFAWKNVEERLGTSLMPLMQDFTHFLLTDASPVIDKYVGIFEKRGVPALKRLAEDVLPAVKKGFGEVVPDLKDLGGVLRDDGVPLLKEFAHAAKPLAHEIIPTLGDTIGVLGDVLGVAAPLATDLVSAFNDMPDWGRKAILAGGLTAFAGSKLGLGSLVGGKGGVAGLLSGAPGSSPAKALYVIPIGGGLGGGVGGVGAAEGAVVAGGRRGSRAATRRGRIGGRVKGGVKAAAAFAAIDALTHFIGGDDVSDDNGNALNNTLTGASLGSFGGPAGLVLGAGFGALYDSYNSTPNSQLPVSKYEHGLAGKENWQAQMDGSASQGDNPWQLGIAALNKQIDAAARRKIQPTFDILGLVQADGKVARLRERAERPIEVPLVAKLDRTLANFFDDAFGGGTPTAGRHRGLPGVHVQGDLVIHAQDHKDFLHKAQRAGLGGRKP